MLSVSEKSNEYATEVLNTLKAAGMRVEANLGSEKIGAKVRVAVMEKIPYQIVVGERDAAARTIAVRTKAGEQGAVAVDDFVKKCQAEISGRALRAE